MIYRYKKRMLLCYPLYENCWITAWTTDWSPEDWVSYGSTGEGNSPVWPEGVEPGSTPPRPHLRADCQRGRISFWSCLFLWCFSLWAWLLEALLGYQKAALKWCWRSFLKLFRVHWLSWHITLPQPAANTSRQKLYPYLPCTISPSQSTTGLGNK